MLEVRRLSCGIIKDISAELWETNTRETSCSHFQPPRRHGKGRICESVPLRDVLRMCGEKSVRISPSIIQSNAICQTVSVGPRRDRGRVEMSACRALGIIPPVNLLHSRAHVWKRNEQTSLCWRENLQMFQSFFFFFLSVQVHSRSSFLIRVLRLFYGF